jgi:flagellar motor switch/type III secretory pathway protein FliN
MVIDKKGMAALREPVEALADAPVSARTPDRADSARRAAPAAERAGAAPRDAEAECAEARRLRHVRVPVVVQLASSRMTIGVIRRFSVGGILEFPKSVADLLELRINNHTIGFGECVKVGENFGLRVTRIATPAQRIWSMGC